MPIDIDLLRARNEARRRGTPEAHVTCEVDIDVLLESLETAEAELARLHQDNEDLRASADLWADLYTASLDRANALEAQWPPDYVRARDAVLVLREALDAFVRDCGLCAPARGGRVWDAPADTFCANCTRAVAALDTARRVR